MTVTFITVWNEIDVTSCRWESWLSHWSGTW